MKHLRLILITLAIILAGFFFYKEDFNKVGNKVVASDDSYEILYDRINYREYSDQALVSSRKNGKTILFFAATTWCSNCKAIEEEIYKRNSEIPKDLTILKVDYDRDRKMKTKFSVSMQTTLILLDKNGGEIKRWIGTDFNNLLANIN